MALPSDLQGWTQREVGISLILSILSWLSHVISPLTLCKTSNNAQTLIRLPAQQWWANENIKCNENTWRVTMQEWCITAGDHIRNGQKCEETEFIRQTWSDVTFTEYSCKILINSAMRHCLTDDVLQLLRTNYLPASLKSSSVKKKKLQYHFTYFLILPLYML